MTAGSRRAVVGRPLLLAVGAIVGGALAEAGVRVYARLDKAFGSQVGNHDPLAVSIEPLGDFGFRQRPNSRFQYSDGTTATTNAMAFRGPLVAVPKPPGTFRIVLLGGSTTHGWKVNDAETIDAFLRQILPRLYHSLQYEAVNLAFDGYDSNQLVERLRHDGLPLEPDLVIVNAGINDVRNARLPNLRDRDPRTLLYGGILAQLRATRQRGHPTLWLRLTHWSFALRLPAMIRTNLAARRAAAQAAIQPPNPQAAELFERNLHRIADLLWARRIPLLFSTPPSALTSKYQPHDTSPVSYWLVDASATQEYRDSLAHRMERLAAELARDGRPVRYVRPELPPELFLDDCHLTPEGNERLAHALASAIEPFVRAHAHREVGQDPARRLGDAYGKAGTTRRASATSTGLHR